MNMKYLAALVLIFTSGCVSVEFVRKDITPTKQAILRYLPPSSEKREAEARELLKKQATEFCGGEYNITKEYQALAERSSSVGIGTGFSTGGGSSIVFSSANRHETMYNFVELVCK
jgi:hypothetical protein